MLRQGGRTDRKTIGGFADLVRGDGGWARTVQGDGAPGQISKIQRDSEMSRYVDRA